VLMIESFRVQLHTKNAYDLAQEIGKSSGLLSNLYHDKTPEGVTRFENIEELMSGIKEFVESSENINEVEMTLDQYMQDIALLTDADEKDKDDRPKVSLMTIHQAKGLEYPYVHVVGLEENLFPSMMALHSRSELEEERRLFYVALTRAEKKVSISYAESRYKWGKLEYCEPSRFIDEIEDQYIDYPHKPKPKSISQLPGTSKGGLKIKANTVSHSRLKPSYKKVETASPNIVNRPTSSQNVSDPEDIHEGVRVEHQRFGCGTVVKIEGEGQNKKAKVKFIKDGEKQLILRFARLRILK